MNECGDLGIHVEVTMGESTLLDVNAVIDPVFLAVALARLTSIMAKREADEEAPEEVTE